MIRAARFIAVVVGGATLATAVAGSSFAADGNLTFNLPAAVYYEQDESGRSEVDKNRCQVAVFVEYPKITRAVSYEIVIRLPKQNNREMQFVAPPFEKTGFTARYPPPDGFGRFSVGAYSTGDGCAAALGVTAGTVKIVSAKVSLDKAFEKRISEADKPPFKCVASPGKSTVNMRGVLGGWFGEDRMIIIRRQRNVTTIEKGSNQPVNLMTNRYATAGTIVKTGPGSIVQIGALDGGSVLVGPNMTIRLTRRGFDVLEQPVTPGFTLKPGGGGQDYKVRTCNAVLAVRG